MRNIMRKILLQLACMVIAAVVPGLTIAGQPVTVTTSPSSILIGTQYDGMKLEVSGTIPAGSDVVLRFTGAPTELHLREKGKVFGLLWMNVGKVVVDNVPKVCIIDSSSPFDKLGPAAASLSLAGLMKQIKVEEGPGASSIDIEKELLLLKKNELLYRESESGVVLGPDNGETRTFSAVLPIPSALAPGHYQVDVAAVRDGQVIAESSTAINAKMVGFPDWLSKLAFGRSLLYGVMATVIALVSGLAIGLVFQSKGAH